MRLQLIRNATLRLQYAGQTIVVDPYLAPQYSRASYRGVSPNPTVELACPASEVVAGLDLALISHMHSDHFDPLGRELLPKGTPLVCQLNDEPELRSLGFVDVHGARVGGRAACAGIEFVRIAGQHGTGSVLADMGVASGFVLRAPGEPTVYLAGDTIWFEAVAEAMRLWEPTVIVTHSCGAVWGDDVLILMDDHQTVTACRAAPPNAVVVAVHMEAVDHATVSRDLLRRTADAAGISRERLLIPADMQALEFLAP